MMRRLFGKKKATPEKLVAIVRTTLAESKSTDPEIRDKAHTEMLEKLKEIQMALYGDDESKAAPVDEVRTKLAEEMMSGEVMLDLVRSMSALPFESRKIVAQIFKHLVHNDVKAFGSSFLVSHIGIVDELVDGYDEVDLSLLTGGMVRECIRIPGLAEYLLKDGKSRDKLFTKYAHHRSFEVSSDALATLKELFTFDTAQHKAMVADFLEKHYETVFGAEKSAADKTTAGLYNQLLNTENYITRRQSLKLLGELLLDRPNRAAMLLFIADRRNLMLIMRMLSDPRPNIQFEAFHVFKVFVANPAKTPGILKLLGRNKDKLIAFLKQFRKDRGGDDQFTEEKALLIAELNQLVDPDAEAAKAKAEEAAAVEAAAAAAAAAEAAAAAVGTADAVGAGGESAEAAVAAPEAEPAAAAEAAPATAEAAATSS